MFASFSPSPSSSPRLAALGWDSAREAELAPHAALGLTPARIVRGHRGGCDVLDATGARRVTYGGGLLDDVGGGADLPTTGDWVALRTWPDARVTVERVLRRRTALVRGSSAGHSRGQVLAANVDVVLVVASLTDDPDLARLERLLALTWDAGALPVVVLTKADLVTDAVQVAREVALAAGGADVLVVSAVTGEGLDALAAYARPGVTLALLGPSGVGKSTLLNALAGAPVQDVGHVAQSGKGRHTTVARELVVLASGAVVVDTPGLRAAGLPDVRDGIARAFTDVEELAGSCRFRDCAHRFEPGCAVLAAVEDGDLPERRLASWRKLQREAERPAARADARVRAEMRRRWKVLHKSARDTGVTRP